MTSAADVIIQTDEGGRRLIRTADSVLRQRVRPSSITLIRPEASQATSLAGSAASRLSAIVLSASDHPGLPLNAAVRSGSGSFFVVLPAGFMLNDAFLER